MHARRICPARMRRSRSGRSLPAYPANPRWKRRSQGRRRQPRPGTAWTSSTPCRYVLGGGGARHPSKIPVGAHAEGQWTQGRLVKQIRGYIVLATVEQRTRIQEIVDERLHFDLLVLS